jgi:serine protease
MVFNINLNPGVFMKNFTKYYIILMLFVAIALNPVFAKPQAAQEFFAPGVVLIKLVSSRANVESSAQLSALTQKYGILEVKQLFHPASVKRKGVDLSRIYKLNVPDDSNIKELCHELQQEPFIEYAEPDYICTVHAIPNDSLYYMQGHLPQIHCEQAWDIAKGSPDVILAFVGTGVDWNHPDLANAIWSNKDEIPDGIDNDGNGYIDDIRGWDFVDGVAGTAAVGEDGTTPDNNPMDFDGHETHCAGLGAAVTNNQRGVAGVSWGCTIMPVRAGYKQKSGTGVIMMDAASSGIIYATDNGASFINYSAGSSGNTIINAVQYAFEHGVLLMNSAGNNDNKAGVDPTEPDVMATLPYVLTVAAVDDRDYKATYSSYGSWVTVSAPGGDQSGGRPGLMSTYFDNVYTALQGTSMAAPVVTGLAGLVKSYHPDWNNADILFQITETADNIDALNPRYQGMLGSGRVNAFRALTESVTVAPKFEMVTYTINDTTTGNGNGLLDIGETAELIVTLRNDWGDAADVSASLTIDDPEVQILNNVSHFGYFSGLRNFSEHQHSNRPEPFLISVDSGSIPRNLNGTIQVLADGLEWNFALTIAIDPKIMLIDDDGNSGFRFRCKRPEILYRCSGCHRRFV